MRHVIKNVIDSLLHPFDLKLVRASHWKEWMEPVASSANVNRAARLPERVETELSSNHPKLAELRRTYAGHPAARHSVWNADYLREGLDLRYFRGDNVYVWQSRSLRNLEIAYSLSTYYALAQDRMSLFERLSEDDFFGNHTFKLSEAHTVSRDLLDSILELNFLEEKLALTRVPGLKILDIGAGYGRLAHRAATAFGNLERFYCVDAVPESTFLCDYYVRFRGLDPKVSVVELPSVEQSLPADGIHLATNICSFSETTLASIIWWLSLVRRLRAKHLFIVTVFRSSTEEDGTRKDYFLEIEKAGYVLKHQQPKYLNPTVHKYGIYPADYYLFELHES
jgi:hypothetical protein